jgi:hypothetical protein
MAKCKNCDNLGYLFDGDRVGERVWCGNIADSPVLDMERDCEYYVPQTNADRIRSMTDEELAEVLFGCCIEHMGVEECSHPEEACKSCVLDWLKEESEE